MRVTSGIDLVQVSRFRKTLAQGGSQFMRRMFVEDEITSSDPRHLAGIFAAKEAIIKALSLPVDSWREITISYNQSGGPQANVYSFSSPLLSHSLSISHDGDYVIAQFVALV